MSGGSWGNNRSPNDSLAGGPGFRVGQRVRCLIRGEVEVASVHDGPIPWPACKTARRYAIIVYAGLARAVRRESAVAVAH